jgi:hypothetical protein
MLLLRHEGWAGVYDRQTEFIHLAVVIAQNAP